MTDNPERPADELVGRWLDEGPLPLDTGALPAGMDDAARRRLAELQLLHGLLTHLHDADTGSRETRVQRVLQALQGPPDVLPFRSARPAGPWRTRTRRTLSWLASAAALLLVALLTWKLAFSNPAYAVVNRALEAAGQERDRTYHVSDEWHGPANLVKATRDGTLDVRGDQFVFRPKNPVFPGLVLGSDGRQAWAVQAVGPVRVSSDPREFFRIMARGLFPRPPDDQAVYEKPLPLLQPRSLLERLGRSYRLEMLASEPLTPDGDTRYQHVRAHRHEEVSGGSEVVDLWVHPDTHVLTRVRFQARPPWGERTVTLDLVGEKPLPAGWYEHSAHHEPGRPVRPWHRTEPLPPAGIPPPDPDGKP